MSDGCIGTGINFNNGIITGNTVSNCEKGIDTMGRGNTINTTIVTN